MFTVSMPGNTLLTTLASPVGIEGHGTSILESGVEVQAHPTPRKEGEIVAARFAPRQFGSFPLITFDALEPAMEAEAFRL